MKKHADRPIAVIDRDRSLPAYVSTLEEESSRLLETARQTEEEMRAYYPRLLEEDHSDA